MRLLPGARFVGPVTANGNVPVYKANGVLAFVGRRSRSSPGASFGLHLFPASIVYDNFGGILGALNVFSARLLPRPLSEGALRAVVERPRARAAIPIFDYYWGTELYPRILGWDVKMFTNCRFGMMAWPLILISFAAKQARSTRA